MSFFEGSEKKLEVVVDIKNLPLNSLKDLGRCFWSDIVEASQAQILSEIQSKKCVAYLLSESSLFVWDNKFTMITCGKTTLANAFLKFSERVQAHQIQSLIYERKNEMLPEDQLSCFKDDTNNFQEVFQHQGLIYTFGSKNDHFIELYEYHNSFIPPQEDTTLEVLMYGISPEAKKIFSVYDQKNKVIHDFLNYKKWAEDFSIDDFIFEPQGYSVNALRGFEYFTIHVTPQDVGSYVSFETNISNTSDHNWLIDKMIQIFQPKSYDILDFKISTSNKVNYFMPGYQQISSQQNELNSGYTVNYAHMSQILNKNENKSN